MNCVNCGASIPDVSVFCLSCGADQRRAATPEPQTEFFSVPESRAAGTLPAPQPENTRARATAQPARLMDEVSYSRTPVYASPDLANARLIAELDSGASVEVLDWDRSSHIVKVRFGNDVQGYVKSIALKGKPALDEANPDTLNREWECANCHERLAESFLSCWKCLTPRSNEPVTVAAPAEWRSAVESERHSAAYTEVAQRSTYSAATRPGPAGRSRSTASQRSMVARWLFLGGAVAIFLCPFLPWLSGFGQSANLSDLSKAGADTPVAELIVISLIGGLGACLRLAGAINHVAARVWACIVGVLALIEFFYVNSQIDDHFSAEIGISRQLGFYVLLLAVLAVLASALVETADD